MKSRFVLITSFALLSLSCSNRYRHQAISPEAGALFARGETTAPGGSLVLDFEVMRELGLIGSDARAAEVRSDLLDLAIFVLSTAAAETPDEERAEMLSRVAVLAAIMRDWSILPEVQRLGAFVPLTSGLADPRAAIDNALVVVATKGDPATTGELLRGLAAVDRAMGGARLATNGSFLCYRTPRLPAELCLKAGPRYLALGTPVALRSIGDERAPASTASGALARVRLDIPAIATGQVLVEGRSSVRISATIRPGDPAIAARLLAAANEGLGKMDGSLAKARALLRKDLERTRQALIADPEAPAGLKAAASRMTLERMLDPGGEREEVRRSIKVALNDGTFSAELVIPEAQIRRLRDGSSAMTSAAVIGVVAAIAVPALVRRAGERPDDSRRSGLEAGAQHDSSGEAADARIAALREKVSREPRNAAAWTQLGNEYFDAHRPKEAIDAYDRALAIRPKDANVLTDQGVMYRELGQLEKAISNFKKASRIDPKHFQSLHNLGIVYLDDLGQADKAIAVWRKALEFAPDGDQADKLRAAIEQARKAKEK